MAEVLFDPPLPEEEALNEVLQVMMWIGFQGAQAESGNPDWWKTPGLR